MNSSQDIDEDKEFSVEERLNVTTEQDKSESVEQPVENSGRKAAGCKQPIYLSLTDQDWHVSSQGEQNFRTNFEESIASLNGVSPAHHNRYQEHDKS